jgi:hypothetical protein
MQFGLMSAHPTKLIRHEKFWLEGVKYSRLHVPDSASGIIALALHCVSKTDLCMSLLNGPLQSLEALPGRDAQFSPIYFLL